MGISTSLSGNRFRACRRPRRLTDLPILLADAAVSSSEDQQAPRAGNCFVLCFDAKHNAVDIRTISTTAVHGFARGIRFFEQRFMHFSGFREILEVADQAANALVGYWDACALCARQTISESVTGAQ